MIRAPWRRVRVDAIAPAAWRNGGGTTREIACWEGARLSLADIDRAGPFSVFAGVRRWIAVLHGRVELRFAGGPIVLDAAAGPFEFDGADAPHADPGPDGACRVLNLMLAPEPAGEAGLQRVDLRAGETLDARGVCAVYVRRGVLRAGAVEVAAGEAFVAGEAGGGPGGDGATGDDGDSGDDEATGDDGDARDDGDAGGGGAALARPDAIDAVGGGARAEWRAGEAAVVLVARLGDVAARPGVRGGA